MHMWNWKTNNKQMQHARVMDSKYKERISKWHFVINTVLTTIQQYLLEIYLEKLKINNYGMLLSILVR